MKKEKDYEELWKYLIIQFERKGKENEEVIKVVNKELTKRAIKTLNAGIVI